MNTTPHVKDYSTLLAHNFADTEPPAETPRRVLRHCEERLREMIHLAIATNANHKEAVQTYTLSALTLGATVEELDLVRKISLCQGYYDADKRDDAETWKRTWQILGRTPGSILKMHRELIALAVAIANDKKRFIDYHAAAAMTLGVSMDQMQSMLETLDEARTATASGN